MNKISIVRCNEYESSVLTLALEQTLANLGGISKYVQPGSKVVFKVNLLMEKAPEQATTTHPAFVEVLVRLVQQAGGVVTIADSPGGPYTRELLERVYKTSGMAAVAEATGATLNYDLSSTEVANPDGKLLKRVTVIQPLIDADLIINLPKLKSHGMMTYTGAVKNLFGAVPGLLKPEYHMKMADYNDFANALIDIFLAVKPQLQIMDAVIGMDGDGPSAGNPKPIGLILAAEDAFALDLSALRIIDVDPMIVPVIKQAVERGLVQLDDPNLEYVGATPDQVRVNGFQLPETGKSVFEAPFLKPVINLMKPKPVFDHSTCIGCADCAKSCPAHVIKMRSKKPQVDLNRCIRCFCCQELCPAQAVSIQRSKTGDFLLNKVVPVAIDLIGRGGKKESK